MPVYISVFKVENSQEYTKYKYDDNNDIIKRVFNTSHVFDILVPNMENKKYLTDRTDVIEFLKIINSWNILSFSLSATVNRIDGENYYFYLVTSFINKNILQIGEYQIFEYDNNSWYHNYLYVTIPGNKETFIATETPFYDYYTCYRCHDHYLTVIPKNKIYIVDGENIVMDKIENLAIRVETESKYLDLNAWNTGNITDFHKMFMDDDDIVDLDLEEWDTSKVTNTSCMFFQCYNLKNVNLCKWDVSKVTNMDSMFSRCKSIEYLNLNNWDISNVEIMIEMFNSCTKLKHLYIDRWVTNNHNINLRDMFYKCYSIKEINLSWVCPKIKHPTRHHYNRIFYRNKSLEKLTISEYIADCEPKMFECCKSIKVLDVNKREYDYNVEPSESKIQKDFDNALEMDESDNDDYYYIYDYDYYEFRDPRMIMVLSK